MYSISVSLSRNHDGRMNIVGGNLYEGGNSPSPAMQQTQSNRGAIADALGQKGEGDRPQATIQKKESGIGISDTAVPLQMSSSSGDIGEKSTEVTAVVSVEASQIIVLRNRIENKLPAFFYDKNTSSQQRIALLLEIFHSELKNMVKFADGNEQAEHAIQSAIAKSETGIITTAQLDYNSCATTTAFARVLESFGVNVSLVPGKMDEDGHAYVLIEFGGEKMLRDAHNPIATGSLHIPLMHRLSAIEWQAFHNGQGSVHADFNLTRELYGIDPPTMFFEYEAPATKG